MKPNCIRVIVLGWIKDDRQRFFVSEGYDPVKQERFYRALGGGVDFGETSLAALKREFQEELEAELTNIRYLACLENLFVYSGQPGHEIVQLYQCDFADSRFYQLDAIPFREGSHTGTALWVKGDRFRSGELRLVPAQCLAFL